MPVPHDFMPNAFGLPTPPKQPLFDGKNEVPAEPSDFQKRFTAVRLAVSHTENIDGDDLQDRIAVIFDAFNIDRPKGWEA